MEKSVICPCCKRFLTKTDTSKDYIHKLKCQNCGKWIWWNPANDYMGFKEVPERMSSSGKRYY